jgi:alkaline phosphatase D
MPLPRSRRPVGASIPLYRSLTFGGLAEFNGLDTRQYRSRTEPCGYGTGEPCEEVFDPSRTMLGEEQERWLFRGLGRSRARWNVLAQQVPLMRLDVAPGEEVALKLDKWDAYPAARDRLFGFLRERRPSNPVAITGDLHDNWVGDLKLDFEVPGSKTVATEFIGTSISSDGDGAERSEEGEIALQENPHVLFHNYRRGYVRCELTPREWRADFRVLPYVTRPGAPVSTRASFVIESGRPGAVRD